MSAVEETPIHSGVIVWSCHDQYTTSLTILLVLGWPLATHIHENYTSSPHSYFPDFYDYRHPE